MVHSGLEASPYLTKAKNKIKNLIFTIKITILIKYFYRKVLNGPIDLFNYLCVIMMPFNYVCLRLTVIETSLFYHCIISLFSVTCYDRYFTSRSRTKVSGRVPSMTLRAEGKKVSTLWQFEGRF